MVQHGFSNPAIAAKLGVSVDAIKYHVGNILAKTGAGSREILKQQVHVPANSGLNTRPQETTMTTSSPMGRIGQISRTVSNLEASKNWYELVLELPHLYTFGTLSFFDCNGTRLMLTQEGALHADESILYFKVDDILGTCDRLQQKGVTFTHAPHRIHTHADGTEEWMAFFSDPDGRPLALMAQVKPNP